MKERSEKLRPGLSDDQDLGAKATNVLITLLHLVQVRSARDSVQVTQEDQEQGPAVKRRQCDRAAIGFNEGLITHSVADLQSHRLVSNCGCNCSVIPLARQPCVQFIQAIPDRTILPDATVPLRTPMTAANGHCGTDNAATATFELVRTFLLASH